MFVDWQQVILNLRKAHYPLGRASVECGMCESWLGKFASSNYAEPAFTPAVKLLQIHWRVCGGEATFKIWKQHGAKK